MKLVRANSFTLSRRSAKGPRVEEFSTAAPALPIEPRVSKLVRTLSAPRARPRAPVLSLVSHLDANRVGTARAHAETEHAPSEWLHVLLAQVRVGELQKLNLSAHVEMRTLSRAQQCETISGLASSRALCELELCNLQLNDAAAKAIASLLALPAGGGPPLARIALERNCLTDLGALAICESLRGNTQLCELSLADQLRQLSFDGVRVYCELLEGAEGVPPNTALRKLNLGRFVDPANALRQRLSKLVMRNVDRAREERSRTAALSALSSPEPQSQPQPSPTAASRERRPSPPLLSARLQPAAHLIEPTVRQIAFAHEPTDWRAEAASLAASLPLRAARLTGVRADGSLALQLCNDRAFVAATPEARAAVLRALGTNRTFARLELSSVQLNDAELQLLAHALLSNRALTSVSLDLNQIGMGPEAVAALTRAFAANATLRELRMSEQRLPWSQAAEDALARALEPNQTLVKLSLGSARSAFARNQIAAITARNSRTRRGSSPALAVAAVASTSAACAASAHTSSLCTAAHAETWPGAQRAAAASPAASEGSSPAPAGARVMRRVSPSCRRFNARTRSETQEQQSTLSH